MSIDDPNVMYANCTCTLIRTEKLTIIVDTMTPWNRKEILDGKYFCKHHLQSVQAKICLKRTYGQLNPRRICLLLLLLEMKRCIATCFLKCRSLLFIFYIC